MSRRRDTEYIYYLHADDGIPKYCGHTIDPDKRLAGHLKEAKGGSKTLKCGWIRAVLARGETVQMRIVDQCPADRLGDLEAYWIDELQGCGFFLMNGNGGVRGSLIDEAALREDINDWKKAKRKPKPSAPVRKRTAKEWNQFEQRVQYWQDNPKAFEAERNR